MKKILVLLIVLSSSSVFAEGVISKSCKQKIESNSATIKESTEYYIETFGDDLMLGLEKSKAVEVAFDLESGLEKVSEGKSLDQDESGVLAQICRLASIDYNEIANILDNTGELRSAEANVRYLKSRANR